MMFTFNMHETGQLHVHLPGDIEAVLVKVMEQRGNTRAQTVRNAIVVLGWFEAQRAEGRRVVSISNDGAERELMWP